MAMREHEWMKRSLCTGMSAEIFFPTPKKTKVNPTQYKAALAICAVCPVQRECLDYAIKHRMIEDGIFGGKMPHQRRMILAKAPKKKVAAIKENKHDQ